MKAILEKKLIKHLNKYKIIWDKSKGCAYIEDISPQNKNEVYFREIGSSDTNHYINLICDEAFNESLSESGIKFVNRHLIFSAKESVKQHEKVHFRVAYHDECIYVDMGNKSVCKITDEIYEIVDDCPVNFCVSEKKDEFPELDINNPDLDLLRKYLPLDEKQYILTLVYIFNCFFTNTHYLILILLGPPGAGKSFIELVIKTLVDPSHEKLKSQFLKKEDFILAAEHCHLIDINNSSELSNPMQDAMCLMLTGGTFTKRKLYSDKEQISITMHNPILINGIGSVVTRDDLLERALTVNLNKLEGEDNVNESELAAMFEEDLPRIQSGVFECLSIILEEFKNGSCKVNKLTRMGDFHILGVVCEKALRWKKGSFEKAYFANIKMNQESVLNDSYVAQALLQLKGEGVEFKGTYKELKTILEKFDRRISSMSERELSSQLDRICGSINNLHGVKFTKLNRSNIGQKLQITYEF